MSDNYADPNAGSAASQADVLGRFTDKFKELKKAISSIIVGQEQVVEDLLIVVLAGGHALIEGAPGLGKTRLVRTFAEATQLSFGRVQFTPDLMPADVTGTTVLNRDESTPDMRFVFQPGPVFTNVLLADEINRATPKTQSALLEAMQERSVTVSGEQHALPVPFITLATQNPLEMEGTYPLPEAQLDRFLFKIMIYRPNEETLKRILRTTTGSTEGSISPIFSCEELLEYQQLLRAVPIAERALDYVVQLTEASHNHPLLRLGASPRGAQAMVLAAKGYALTAGRPNVELEDIRRAILPALRHRLLLGFEAEVEGRNVDDIVLELQQQVDQVSA
jgi:MoxR-like ATPase